MFFLFFIKIASILSAIVGVTFSIPIGVALYCGEYQVLPGFVIPMLISFLLVTIINITTHIIKNSLNLTDLNLSFILSIAVSFLFYFKLISYSSNCLYIFPFFPKLMSYFLYMAIYCS